MRGVVRIVNTTADGLFRTIETKQGGRGAQHCFPCAKIKVTAVMIVTET